jgi:hypothetical protein
VTPLADKVKKSSSSHSECGTICTRASAINDWAAAENATGAAHLEMIRVGGEVVDPHRPQVHKLIVKSTLSPRNAI